MKIIAHNHSENNRKHEKTTKKTAKIASGTEKIANGTEKTANEFLKIMAKLHPEALLDICKNKFNNNPNGSEAIKQISASFQEKDEIKEIRHTYHNKVERLKTSVIILKEKDDKKEDDKKKDDKKKDKAYAIFPYEKSRYSPKGQRKMRREFRERLNGVEDGVFLTMTVDPKRLSLLEAWEYMKSLSDILNHIKINKNRDAKKHGKTTIVDYSRVIEVQKSGYPHVHVFYPGLEYLLPKEEIEAIWGAGFIYVQSMKRVNIGSYMAKYMAKGERLYNVLPFLMHFHLRLYSFTQFKSIPRTKKEPKEHTYVIYKFTSIHALGTAYIDDGSIDVIDFFGGGGLTFLDSHPGTEELDYQYDEKKDWYLIMPMINFVLNSVPKFFARVNVNLPVVVG